jgi:hypothetical protein
MKLKVPFTLILALVPVGCGSVVEQAKNMQEDSASSDDAQAANELYLDDVTDSAAETEDSSTEVDSSIEEDTKNDRLVEMAASLMTKLDTDESGNLTLEEFLVGPEKRAVEKDLSKEKCDRLTERMSADFTKYAGEDQLLSIDELQTLLKEVAPRVGRHRHKNFKGKHKERVKQTWSEIVAKYDADGDGSLNEQEFSALEADREKVRATENRCRKGHKSGKGSDDGKELPPPPPPFEDHGSESEGSEDEESEKD